MESQSVYFVPRERTCARSCMGHCCTTSNDLLAVTFRAIESYDYFETNL